MSAPGELVSLAAVQAWVGQTSDGTLLSTLIGQVSRAVLAYIGRSNILPGPRQETRDGDGHGLLMLRHWPALEIERLEIDGRLVGPVPMSGAGAPVARGYVLEQGDAAPPGRMQALYLRGERFRAGLANVRLRYTAGYRASEQASVLQPRRRRRGLRAFDDRPCLSAGGARSRGAGAAQCAARRFGAPASFLQPLAKGARAMSFLRQKSNSAAPVIYTGMQVQTSSGALPIPILWGLNQIAPNAIWSGNFRALRQTASGGKGGGSVSAGYDYRSAVIMGLCEGPIAGVGTIWNSQTVSTLASLGLTLFAGQTPQPAWSYTATAFAGQALGYNGTAYVCSADYDMGSSAGVGALTFEVQGCLALSAAVNGSDADPALVVLDFLTNPQYGVGFRRRASTPRRLPERRAAALIRLIVRRRVWRCRRR
jgi:hypothetical protein